jgi:AraC-like DNA-binding protein
MFCERIFPRAELRHVIREYVVSEFTFADTTKMPPLRVYPANPDEALRFLLRGHLYSTDPATGRTCERPTISIIGQPTARRDLQITHEFQMFYVRFQPGSLYKLFRVPMALLRDEHFDATAVLGREATELHEQLGTCHTYEAMISVMEVYILKRLSSLKNNSHPVDRIGSMILQNPQAFNLERTAKDACLSYRQFEKRFEQLVGITPKYFARIARFYQAFVLKECHPELDWLSIAVRTGYNDYQHMVKDFKEFAGTTPTVLIKESLDSPSRAFTSSSGFRGV